MSKITRKKPAYIRKYDYIRYFYRPKDEWFYSTKDLEKYIHDLILTNIQNSSLIFDDFDIDDEKNLDGEESEIDTYSLINEMKADGVDLDENDPKVFEGNIIDQKSKLYIEKYFVDYFNQKDINNIDIIDFSKLKLNNEQQFAKTMEYLQSHNYAIMFQPTFIARNKAIAKPDALINDGGKLILVETKGTTNPKFNHLVDIYYQNQIINEALKEKDFYIDEYYLCIVKYELLNLKQISFVLTKNCSLSKSGFATPKEAQEYIHKLSLKESTKIKSLIREAISDFSPNDTTIKSLLQNKAELSSKRAQGTFEKKYSFFFEKDETFWKIIDELYDYQIDNSLPSLIPNDKYNSEVKNNDYLPLLKDYYFSLCDKNGNSKYPSLQFSGHLIKINQAIHLYRDYHLENLSFDKFISELATNNELFDEQYKKSDALSRYLKYICKDNKILTYAIRNGTQNYFDKLKSKKVYFDFESLNIATRVVDNYPPFMQVVNQVSVIFDHGDKNLKLLPFVIIDPINGINKNDFKKIIDSILPNNDLEICKQYSYVVYNKNFECIRLREMAKYINEDEYFKKVSIIVENIYDLADFFNISSAKLNCQIILKELKGFYSIKKVLPLVEKYDYESFKTAGCKNYKTELVQITNGKEAQNASTKRFFSLISDSEWKVTAENLGKYCDNDVRAMVAVEYFVKNILDGKVHQ